MARRVERIARIASVLSVGPELSRRRLFEEVCALSVPRTSHGHAICSAGKEDDGVVWLGARPFVLRDKTGELDPRVDSELGERVAEMRAHGVGRDEETLADLTIAKAERDETHDVQLRGRQSFPASSCRCGGADATTDTERTQARAYAAGVP